MRASAGRSCAVSAAFISFTHCLNPLSRRTGSLAITNNGDAINDSHTNADAYQHADSEPDRIANARSHGNDSADKHWDCEPDRIVNARIHGNQVTYHHEDFESDCVRAVERAVAVVRAGVDASLGSDRNTVVHPSIDR